MGRNGGEEEACNTELRLSIGAGNFMENAKKDEESKKMLRMSTFGTSFPLGMNSMNEINRNRNQEESQDEDDDDVVELVGVGMNKEKRNRTSINGRKKLRLSRDQLGLLEETFKLQSTLNTAQKQALAERLNLQPRQIEVWFQNRRARTKLKQTEVDCDFLKKCCERLNIENQRLRKEVHDLRAARAASHPGLLYNTATTSKSRHTLI
ncbi:homeobox-leucine zipper protein HAT22-like [Impatiens glandulifera]|uniref:homeobox-leucine zipper protein HAT22-like n=1 Tax=Impatiens glandulifera TaxID=253017 RepID=UPI001FB05125|nr:homeobox-leucine zipper protein HAT22-like [Impatiens glandulifera]